MIEVEEKTKKRLALLLKELPKDQESLKLDSWPVFPLEITF